MSAAFRELKDRRGGTRTVYGNETSQTVPSGAPEPPRSRFVRNQISNTKYNIITFLPKNLYEQFSQNMNRYFLLIGILQYFRQITPVDPITTWLPLFVIFSISALKEGMDDYRRFQADKQWNHKYVTVVRCDDATSGDASADGGVYTSAGGSDRDGGIRGPRDAASRYDAMRYRTVAIHSEDVCVGDIVLVRENEECCADLVVLKTSSDADTDSNVSASGSRDAPPLSTDEKSPAAGAGAAAAGGACYIQTANVDGETNLKLRTALPQTQSLPISQIHRFRGIIECAQPNNNIYSFDSTLQFDARSPVLSLSSSQLLLQATTLKNTRWVYGVAVYTGNETKINQNRTLVVPRKWTQLDKTIDRYTVVIFIVQLTLTLSLGLAGIGWDRASGADGAAAHWYLETWIGRDKWYTGIVIPLRFLLLASMMIPISLKVTLDICKLFYSLLVNWDLRMYDSSTNQPAHAANTSIGEDLGCVGYVLTDKTGTLTENEMLFRRCAVYGQLFGEAEPTPVAALPVAAIAAPAAAGVSIAEPVMAIAVPIASASRGAAPVATAIPVAAAAAPVGGGITTDVFQDASLLGAIRTGQTPVLQFLRHLALCNTCVPSTPADAAANERKSPYDDSASASASAKPVISMDRKDEPIMSSAAAQGVVYASSSPDELALVDAAKRLGVVLAKRERARVTLHITAGRSRSASSGASAAVGGSRMESFTVLHTLEFSSDRKRMSVILESRDPKTGAVSYTLWCKGADDKVLERLTPGSKDTNERLQFFRPVLDRYAAAGLRTLCYAYKTIEPNVYTEWAEKLRVANTTVSSSSDAASADGMSARERAVNACYEQMEAGLQLIGVSGIEDRLQPGVNETITSLRGAGIKVWMLTGDKYQTALEISRSCGLVTGSDRALSIIGVTRDQVLQQLQTHLDAMSVGASGRGGGGDGYSVIIDGVSLAICLHHFAPQFAELTAHAVSVVCCRVTPSQKADVVGLVSQYHHAVTLAIGDGGNDVCMIQKADIGVGVYGKEGLQAARAADYSIARFRYLTRLVLVHGRYAYSRTSFIAQYCFYKSAFICLIQLMFGFYSFFSGASLLDSFSLMCYNIFYTSLPAVFYTLEKDVSESTIVQQPALYQRFNSPPAATGVPAGGDRELISPRASVHGPGAESPSVSPAWAKWLSASNVGFTRTTIGWWAITALYQSIVVITLTLGTSNGTFGAGAGVGENEQTSTALTAYSACVLIQTLMMWLETSYFTKYNVFIIWGTLFMFFVFNWMAGAVSTSILYHIFTGLNADPIFWFRVILITTWCVLPVFVAKVIKQQLWPSAAESARRIEILNRRRYGDHGRQHSRTRLLVDANANRQPVAGQPHDAYDDTSSVLYRSQPAGGSPNHNQHSYQRMIELDANAAAAAPPQSGAAIAIAVPAGGGSH